MLSEYALKLLRSYETRLSDRDTAFRQYQDFKSAPHRSEFHERLALLLETKQELGIYIEELEAR